MQTPLWMLTLLLASLQTSEQRTEGNSTQCVVAPVVVGEPGKMTFYFREGINFTEDEIFAHLRRGDDEDTMTCLEEDGVAGTLKCNTANPNFVTSGFANNILELHIPHVSQDMLGIYVMKIYVNHTLEPRIDCDFDIKDIPSPTEDTSTTSTVVGVVVGLLVCIAIGVGLLLYFLVIRKRRNSRNDETQEEKDAATGLNMTTLTSIGDGDTTTAPEVEGERDALLTNDPSDPTPPLPSSPQPDTGVSSPPQGLRGDGDVEDTIKAPEVRRETTALLTDGASDPTPPHPLSPQSDTGVSATLQGPRGDGVSSPLRDDGDNGDRGSVAPETEDETDSPLTDGAPGPTPPNPPFPQPDAGISSATHGPPEDETKVTSMSASLRSIRNILKEIMDQNLHCKDATYIWTQLEHKTELSETITQWDALRTEIAHKVNLELSKDELKEKAQLLVQGASDKDRLVEKLSLAFHKLRRDTKSASRTVETDKTVNVLCLCLNLKDMVDMSARNRHMNNMLDTVATELQSYQNN